MLLRKLWRKRFLKILQNEEVGRALLKILQNDEVGWTLRIRRRPRRKEVCRSSTRTRVIRQTLNDSERMMLRHQPDAHRGERNRRILRRQRDERRRG